MITTVNWTPSSKRSRILTANKKKQKKTEHPLQQRQALTIYKQRHRYEKKKQSRESP